MPQDHYPDLLPAIRAAFAADSTLTTAFPGGLLNVRAAASTEYPYARLSVQDPQPGESADDQHFLLAIACYAATDDDATAAGKLLFEWLDGGARSAFANGGWTETCARRVDPAGDLVLLPQPGPDGIQVWRLTVTYEFFATPAALNVY